MKPYQTKEIDGTTTKDIETFQKIATQLFSLQAVDTLIKHQRHFNIKAAAAFIQENSK